MGIKQAQKREMIDYMVSRLDGSGERISPVRLDLQRIGNVDLIKVGDDGIVLLANRAFPNDGLRQLYGLAREKKQRVATVFYKDGETFFRSAAEKGYFGKLKDDRSLKNYTTDDMHRMILTRPEEVFMADRNKYVQYYQPQSERLQQGIVSVSFSPVKFDYSHRRFVNGFELENKDSEKLRIWSDRIETQSPISLKGDYLVGR